jgi:glycosyltransferase involved in cell wall biosynthesis
MIAPPRSLFMSESMSDAPLISVILPNRNHAHFLPAALDSFLAQTWTNFELLVIDDASSDDSREVVGRYCERDRRVRLLPLSSHHGVNLAVREALRVIGGEYICMAAADDFVEPNFLEKTIAVLRTVPEAAFCFSDPSELIDTTGERRYFPLKLAPRPIFFDRQAFADLLAANYFHVSPQTILFRRAAFVDAGGFLPDLEWMSDWFVTLVAAFRHGVCYIPETLTCLRMRSDSIWAVSSRDRVGRRRVVRQILTRLSEPAYADVRDLFRRATVAPEYHLGTLVWLLGAPEGRALVTPRLVGRILARASWSFLRPFAPLSLRRKLRQSASAGSSAFGSMK